MKNLSVVLLALLGFLPCWSQVPSAQTIKTAYGTLELKNMRLMRTYNAQQPCGFGMGVENASSVGWLKVEFLVVVGGRDTSDTPWSYRATLSMEDLTSDAARYVAEGCNGTFSFSEVDKFSVTLAKGTPDPKDVADLARSRASADVGRKRAAALAAGKAAALAKLPMLNSGMPMAFLGSDRKCAAQFQEALAMEGLEKRKRLADLVSYGCGIVASNPIHVVAGQREANFTFVTLAEGKDEGESGWVAIAWVK